MFDQSQTCPSCRSSKYSNPELRLMVNTCGHSLCENCVEVLFVRGSGLCVQCKTPIRKVNFRYQLFEDPLVQKEVELRKKILSDFNKREEDFTSIEEYDLYLEKIEELVYNLMNDIDVDECKRYIENYKKENKEVIKKNRLRPSASMLFYESELEREKLLREKREKEDEARRQALLKGGNLSSPNTDATPELTRPARTDTPFNTPATIKPAPPSVLRHIPPTQFYSPATATRFPPDRFFLPPPPSAAIGGVSMLAAPPTLMCPPSVSNWTSAALHHQVVLPPPRLSSQLAPRPADDVVLPNRSMQTRSLTRSEPDGSAFVYTPYEPDLCGPPVPKSTQSRWNDIEDLYINTIVRLLVKPGDKKPSASPSANCKLDEDEPAVKRSRRLADKVKKDEEEEDVATDAASLKQESPSSVVGSSQLLPTGACGIAPTVFLERCLQESRCALFL